MPGGERDFIGAGEALSRGFRQVFARAPLVLLVALCCFASILIPWAMLGVLFSEVAAWGVGAAALMVVYVLALALRVLLLGGGVHQISARLRGEPIPALLPASLRTSGRALVFGVVAFGVEMVVLGAAYLALGSGVLALVRSFFAQAAPVVGAFTCALGVSLAVFLALLVVLVWPIAFVRSVLEDVPVLASLADSVRRLFARPWAFVVVVGLTGAFGVGLQGMAEVSSRGGDGLTSEGLLPLIAVGVLLGTALSAMLQSVFAVWRIASLTALELNSNGRLERARKPSVPVRIAEPVVAATVVSPGESTGQPLL